jgi:hypothetical protein
LWVHTNEPTDLFKRDPRCMCIDHQDIYFSEKWEDFARCQALCVQCPLFKDCTRWTLANYPDLPFGTFAGMHQDLRARIYSGREDYYDWRQDWNRREYVRKVSRAVNRRNQRQGVSKRARKTEELPPCPLCECSEAVTRWGRDRETNRQLYRCVDCRKQWRGEEL